MEDVEDVACTVDDIEAKDRSGSLIRRGWSEGRGDKGTTVEMMEGHRPRCRRCKAVETPTTSDWHVGV